MTKHNLRINLILILSQLYKLKFTQIWNFAKNVLNLIASKI